MSEIAVPLIAEDFDEGDRVYHYDSHTDKVSFGTVAEVMDRVIKVWMDDGGFGPAGELMYVDMYFFEKDDKGESIYAYWWAKSMDLTKIKEGSILSYLDPDTKIRHEAVVNYFMPESHMDLTFLTPEGKMDFTKYFWEEPGNSLETQLRNFELEG